MFVSNLTVLETVLDIIVILRYFPSPTDLYQKSLWYASRSQQGLPGPGGSEPVIFRHETLRQQTDHYTTGKSMLTETVIVMYSQ